MPPVELFEPLADRLFVPDRSLVDWMRETFIDEDASLHNEDHLHLNSASIGALWTNVPNGKGGKSVIGTCEQGLPMGSKWQRGRAEMQMNEWFGHVPDFILTFYAPYCTTCTDAEFFALVEHELYHAGQAHDQFGAPRFNKKTGMPVFQMRGHDVEEFVGVVSRYGADAAHVRAFADAAQRAPEISGFRISQVCGTCKLRAA